MKKLIFLLILLPFGIHAQIITTITGNGTWSCSGDGGPATAAHVGQLNGIVVDFTGNVIISCLSCRKVRKIDGSGTITTSIGTGTGGSTGDGGQATAANIGIPTGLAIDRLGNLYMSDAENSVIRKVTPSGIISTIAGDASIIGGGYSGDGGLAVHALLNYPQGLAADTAGNLYIADASNSVIRKIDASGIITRVAGNGMYGFAGDGGPATDAQIQWANGVATDNQGNFYIADQLNNRVRKVDAAGIITTIAGNGTYGYSGDGGPATNAALSYPNDIKTDSHGNIYIADYRNHVIRKVDTSGRITTFAGNGILGDAGDGGVATLANLNDPEFVTTDKNNFVYIAELNGARVRKVDTCIAPVIAPITGDTFLCTGMTVTLSDTTLGGIWSSFDTTVASINSSGVVSSLSKGLTPISYTVTNSCATLHVSRNVIVGPYAGVISGEHTICPFFSLLFTSNIPGGTWLSTNPLIATVSGTGLVSTGSPYLGYSDILYIVTDSCGIDTASFRVNDSCFEGATHNALQTTEHAAIYPNPTKNNFTVLVSSGLDEPMDISISNTIGQVLYKLTGFTNQKKEIGFNEPVGIYFITITTAGKKYCLPLTRW